MPREPSILCAQRLSASLESSHSLAQSDSNGAPQCSTPFGIIGIFTCATYRLAAQNSKCSTPFGIIGIFTTAAVPVLRRTPVLNAFRHHWNLHESSERMKSDQFLVLNAFRHHWNLHSDTNCSMNSSSDVLNAFRHHWNLHGVGFKSWRKYGLGTAFRESKVFALVSLDESLLR